MEVLENILDFSHIKPISPAISRKATAAIILLVMLTTSSIMRM
jgi:hypothetical protein